MSSSFAPLACRASSAVRGSVLASTSSKVDKKRTPLRRRRVDVRAKKGGAFLKEFGPEPTPEEKAKQAQKEEDATGGFPPLVKSDTDPFSVNLMVKKVGPLNMVWNGVGTLQTPDAGDKSASVNLARVCLAQRAELLIENFERLYPKLKNERVEWALQPFDDAYGDAFDPFMSLPEDQQEELVPGNLQFLKKPRKVAPGQ